MKNDESFVPFVTAKPPLTPPCQGENSSLTTYRLLLIADALIAECLRIRYNLRVIFAGV